MLKRILIIAGIVAAMTGAAAAETGDANDAADQGIAIAQAGDASQNGNGTSRSTPTAATGAGYAIAGWIEKIDETSDWSAGFTDLTYDPATDTSVLTGLTIDHSAIQLKILFKPISITGYSEQDDGTFGAESIVTEGAAVFGSVFTGTIADVRLDGLGNLAKNFGLEEFWDPQRPFTSMIEAYSRFTDIRLKHGGIGAVSFVVDDNGDEISVTYDDLSIDDWADGKIASATTGPLKFSALGGPDPVVMQISGTELRGLDYAAMLRIYDPDQYVGGVGDLTWRTAVEFIGYGNFVIDTPEARIAFGAVNLQNLRVRQPEQSFAEVYDRIILDPRANQEPSIEEFRAMLNASSAFSIGELSIQNVDVAGDDGTRANLGGITIADLSMEGLAEFSINDFQAEQPGEGSVKLGRFAVGGLVFPNIDTYIDFASSETSVEEFDFSKLAVRLGFFELLGVDVDAPDTPRVQLEKIRLDLANYIGPIPTSFAFDVAGVNLPAAAIDDSSLRAIWRSLGYDRIRGDFSTKIVWDEVDESIQIDNFRISIDEVGALALSAQLGGLSRESIEDFLNLDDALDDLSLIRAELSLDNYAILDRWIEQQAATTGNEKVEIRQQITVLLSEMTAEIGDAGFQEQLRRVLEASIIVPGSVRVTAMPSAPIPLVGLALLAAAGPASLPEILGITIQANTGLGSDETGGTISTDQDDAVAFRDRGIALHDEGDFDRAIAEYDKAIEIDPDYTDAYNDRGIAYRDKGDYDSAIADYDKAIALNPTYVFAYNNRGNAFRDKGDYDSAIADYDKAIEIDLDYAHAYNNRGNAYSDKGDTGSAIADYDRAIELNPDDTYAYNNRGNAYSDRGDYDRAIADLDKAIQLNPTDAITRNDRGHAYFAKGDIDRAIANFDKAIEIDPNYALAYANRGVGKQNKGIFDGAIADYSRAIEIDPQYAFAYYSRGNTHFDKGDHDRAIVDYDKATEIDPNYFFAYNNRGLAFAEKGNFGRAIVDYNKAIELRPDDAFTYYNRGNAFDSSGDNDRAILDYNKAIEIDPDYTFAYNNRGLAVAETGDLDRAIADYDSAIRLDPNYALPYANRGAAYDYKNDLERALADYDKAIELNPGLGPAYYNRGKARFFKGDFESAAPDFRQLTAQTGNMYGMLWLFIAQNRAGQDAIEELTVDAETLESKEWPYPLVELLLGRQPADAIVAKATTPRERCQADFYAGEWHFINGRLKDARLALRSAVELCPTVGVEDAGIVTRLDRIAEQTLGLIAGMSDSKDSAGPVSAGYGDPDLVGRLKERRQASAAQNAKSGGPIFNYTIGRDEQGRQVTSYTDQHGNHHSFRIKGKGRLVSVR